MAEDSDSSGSPTGGVSTVEGPKQVTPSGEEVGSAVPPDDPTSVREQKEKDKKKSEEEQEKDGGDTTGGVSTKTGPELVKPSGEEASSEASKESVEEFGSALGLDADTASQREQLRVKSRINEMEEGGFTEREREAVQAAQQRIDQAEAITESEETEQELRSTKTDLKSSEEAIRNAPSGSTFIVEAAEDEQANTISRNEALSRFREGNAPGYIRDADPGTEFVALTSGAALGRVKNRVSEVEQGISEQEEFQSEAQQNIQQIKGVEQDIMSGEVSGFVTERERRTAERSEELELEQGSLDVSGEAIYQDLSPTQKVATAGQYAFTDTLDLAWKGITGKEGEARQQFYSDVEDLGEGQKTITSESLESLSQNPAGIVGVGMGLGGAARIGVGAASAYSAPAGLTAKTLLGAAGGATVVAEGAKIKSDIESGDFEEAGETATRFGLGAGGFIGGYRGTSVLQPGRSSTVTSDVVGRVGRFQSKFKPGETADYTGGLRGDVLTQVRTERQTVPRSLLSFGTLGRVSPTKTRSNLFRTTLRSDTLKTGGEGEAVGRIEAERFTVPRILEPGSGRLRPRPEFGERIGRTTDVFETGTQEGAVFRRGLRFTQEAPEPLEITGSRTLQGRGSIGVRQTLAEVEGAEGTGQVFSEIGVTSDMAPFRVVGKTETLATDRLGSVSRTRTQQETQDADLDVKGLVETGKDIFGESAAEVATRQSLSSDTAVASATGTQDETGGGSGDISASTSGGGSGVVVERTQGDLGYISEVGESTDTDVADLVFDRPRSEVSTSSGTDTRPVSRVDTATETGTDAGQTGRQVAPLQRPGTRQGLDQGVGVSSIQTPGTATSSLTVPGVALETSQAAKTEAVQGRASLLDVAPATRQAPTGLGAGPLLDLESADRSITTGFEGGGTDLGFGGGGDIPDILSANLVEQETGEQAEFSLESPRGNILQGWQAVQEETGQVTRPKTFETSSREVEYF